MLLLALPQIDTPVFHLWKSVALDNAWDGDSHPFIFFSLACFRAFRDAPPSRFWRRDLKLCLLHFLKMLHLALSQIYKRVFDLWKSVALDNACMDQRFSPIYIFFLLTCFCSFSDAAHSRFGCGDPKLFLQGSLKMLVLALHQIYTNVFHLWKSIDLNSG